MAENKSKEESETSEAELELDAAEAPKSKGPAKKKGGGGLLSIFRGGKKKGKKSDKRNSAPEVLWTVRVELWVKEVGQQLLAIVSGVRSPDAPTRRMAFVFIFSAIGLIVITGISFHRLRQIRVDSGAANVMQAMSATGDEAKHLSEFIGKQADAAHRKFSTVEMGDFSVELKVPPDEKPTPGVANLATIEIVLECDSRETANFVEENLPQARSQLTDIFVAIDRDDLMTREGKKRIKKALVNKLNLWLPKGKIENLFFSKLIIG